jgi:hypothetical protein
VISEHAGVTKFFSKRKGIIFYIKATLSHPLSTGSIRVHLAKNGAYAAIRVTQAEWQTEYPTIPWPWGGSTYVIVNFDDLVMMPADAQSKRRFYWADARANPVQALAGNADSGYNNRFFARDYLEAWVEASDVSPSPLCALIEFYGMYTDNDEDGPSPSSDSIISEIGPVLI